MRNIPNPAESPYRFCFTLDTEPDNLWASSPTNRFDHFPKLLDFHEELVKRGARPTYLTTSEVVEHPDSARVMGRILDTGAAEIGAHFHTWTRPWPFPVPDLGTPPVHACAHQLGQELEERMLRYTCESIHNAMHTWPNCYRGGRWSLNGHSLRSLRSCGIRIDTTITPGLSWEQSGDPRAMGPDFRAFPRNPSYLVEGEALTPSPRGDVLELPVGVSFHPDRQSIIRRDARARVRGWIRRITGRPHGIYWLRPTLMRREEMRTCLESLRNDGVTTWVAMIHSSEMIPCKYFPTEADVRGFVDRCFGLVEDAMALGAVGSTLSEVELELAEQHENHRLDIIRHPIGHGH
jgi:hypothetical protein